MEKNYWKNKRNRRKFYQKKGQDETPKRKAMNTMSETKSRPSDYNQSGFGRTNQNLAVHNPFFGDKSSETRLNYSNPNPNQNKRRQGESQKEHSLNSWKGGIFDNTASSIASRPFNKERSQPTPFRSTNNQPGFSFENKVNVPSTSTLESSVFKNFQDTVFSRNIEYNKAFLETIDKNKAMSTKKLLLLSNGTMYGSEYLQYAANEIKTFLTSNNVSKVLFIPYALKDQDAYEEKARKAFKDMGFEMESIHKSKDPLYSVGVAEAVFVGGGNTFKLLKTLYEKELLLPIRDRVLQEGMPYLGASAGTNVATVNICTTNDMPIVEPPSFAALNLVPFNINPHYIEPDKSSKHMGETRETRIEQYLECEESYPVLGLREGSILMVEGSRAILKGLPQTAKLFQKNQLPKEFSFGSDLSFLLKT